MNGFLGPTLASILLLVPWMAFFIAAAPSWREGAYYSLGWAVPWMAFALMWTQIRKLQFGSGFQVRRRGYGSRRFLATVLWIVVVSLILFSGVLLRLIESSDPLWRLPLGFQALWSAGVCLVMVALLLGSAGVRALLGTQIFLVAATPWPVFWERSLIVPFNEFVASAAALASNFGGNPAQVLEDQLWISGVAHSLPEACGGWLSLPAAVLLAIFFGEWFSVRVLARVGLLALGLFLAAVANFCRLLEFPVLSEPAVLFAGVFLLLLLAAWTFRVREQKSLTPLPLLRWHPAFFFLLLAWPVSEAVNAWWKNDPARPAWKFSDESSPGQDSPR